MNVDAIKPGNIVKYGIKDPLGWSNDAEQVFEVKAVYNDKIFGQELTNISKKIDNAKDLKELTTFEIIA